MSRVQLVLVQRVGNVDRLISYQHLMAPSIVILLFALSAQSRTPSADFWSALSSQPMYGQQDSYAVSSKVLR
jgi:hypothetical protein